MECKNFEDCSAPMCPRDSGAASTAWFPGEPVCRLLDVPDWVKRQRKVARKAAAGYSFTFAMLQQDCRIAQGIKGIDPDGTDKERTEAEKNWLSAHPAITEAEREKMRVIGEKNKAFLTGKVVKNSAPKRASSPSGAKDMKSYGKGFGAPENA